MHVLISDSGVGGLSVCAYAERFLRTHGVKEPVRLTYVNASPENDFGYNAMGSREEKLVHFDRFLHIVADSYSPDSIYIACNTLSVLLQDTRFIQHSCVPVRGIVETGINRLIQELSRTPDCAVMIFGTATTIDAQTYPRLLEARGIPGANIVSQACPGLADTISEDRLGLETKKQIKTHVRAALSGLTPITTSCLAYLACTHYGYRQEFFSAAFEDAGIQSRVLNPNEFVVDDLFKSPEHSRHEDTESRGGIDVEFVTRYRIPEAALDTITHFLGEVSPATILAFQNFTHRPDLF